MELGALEAYFTPEFIQRLIKGFIFLAIALPVLYMVRRAVRNWVTKQHSAHYGMLASKILGYVLMVIVLVVFLTELGFSLGPLLGAAGVFGVAIGFAAQTSVSNIISGFFLIAEKPFVVGDVIQVGGTTGVVLSIDTLSAKLRTFDNRFVRIPNEILIKSEVTTLTRFPIRRIDLSVGVAYKEDLAKVKQVLLGIANDHPLALQEPAPQVNFQSFGPSSVDFMFLVWTTKEHFIQVKNELNESIKRRFDEEGIEIPFPQQTVHIASDD